MKALTCTLTLIFVCSLTFKGVSQSRSEHMIWLQATEKVQFNPTVSGLVLVQKRLFTERAQTYQDLIWVSGDYQLKHLKAGGGMMYFSYHKRLASSFKAVPELRPFQYLTYGGRMATSLWTYHIRAMVEQRFLSQVTGDEVATGKDFQLRYRLRCNATFELAPHTLLKLGNEFLWAHEMELVQNRATAELAYAFRPFGLAVGYMNWYVKGIRQPWRHSWLLKISHRLKMR